MDTDIISIVLHEIYLRRNIPVKNTRELSLSFSEIFLKYFNELLTELMRGNERKGGRTKGSNCKYV
jgi:hypothetical protein